ncbi:MAG: hypothetical protein KKB30_02945 [Proteobacteria bacterium]|nr:hypothetical protein [Pseudomonadota bacterium]MBU1716058.1 hypothetical protein [Pseudomonadota bacterium]
MSKMIDPRFCKNFLDQDICPNWDLEIMAYLDNRVVSPLSLPLETEAFDKAFAYCASCTQFQAFDQIHGPSQSVH